MTPPDPPTEIDLAAFVEGQLDPARRYEVAGWLARHPDQAARVMADLHVTEGLRLALAGPLAPAPPEMRAGAVRLRRRMGRRHTLRRVWPVAAAMAIFALGWTGHALMPRPNPLASAIAAALEIEATLAIGQAMGTLPDTSAVDPAGLATRLGIAVPALPPDWRVRTVHVVQHAGQPGIAILLDTPTMGEILLFSAGLPVDGPDLPPRSFQRDGKALAAFEKGQAAYVLVDASAPMADLAGGAQELLARFN